MNSRAFFSVFVALFAVIFLVSLYHAQHTRFDTQSSEIESAIVHQQLSKDWFLVRNALSNFASDAMLNHITVSQSSPVTDYSGCSAYNPSSSDFGPDINAYWDAATTYADARFSTNCDVNLSGAVEFQMEGSSFSEAVRSGERAYGLLTCSRATSRASLTMTRPFVIRKEVRKDFPAIGECRISVFDVLGTNDDASSGLFYEKLDVNVSFIN